MECINCAAAAASPQVAEGLTSIMAPMLSSSILGVVSLATSAVALNYTFPDCVNGPLKSNLVCNTSANFLDRARAVVDLFTVQELMSNSVNLSPGVPRLGLPSYQWWSEALVCGSHHDRSYDIY